jgi:DNA-binding transcriptional regulator YiaG
MRGARIPAVRPLTNENQNKLRDLSRHRRSKIARAAHTTLVKVDQWGRGEALPGELGAAIEQAVVHGMERKSKKKV